MSQDSRDGLVRFAGHLSGVAGSRSRALDLAVELSRRGASALGERVGGDTRSFLIEEARRLDLIDEHERPNAIRTAELVLVCAILGRAGDPPPREPAIAGLLFTVPDAVWDLVPPSRRIAMAVEDSIRMARASLRLGGPFWDDLGFERLLEVLAPAINKRGVACSFFVHEWPDEERRKHIVRHIARLGPSDAVPIYWYRGPQTSLMHAKFVVADSKTGVLSTANLTSYGFEHHIEVGVRLDVTQSRDLERLLDGLVDRDLFRVGRYAETGAEG